MHDAHGVEVVEAADELVHEPLDLYRCQVVLAIAHLTKGGGIRSTQYICIV